MRVIQVKTPIQDKMLKLRARSSNLSRLIQIKVATGQALALTNLTGQNQGAVIELIT